MSHLAKARAAWGADLPDWVEALAQRCDQTSQNRTATQVKYTAGALSCVIGRTYAGNYAAVEQAVRATLMAASVTCPALGPMGLDQCLEWRGRARAFAPTSALRGRMYDACNACSQNPEGTASPEGAVHAAR